MPKGTAGPSSCSSPRRRQVADPAPGARRTASCPRRPTSTSGSPTPSATRRSTRRETGSAAAPTAGLHFTPELLARVAHERITLHVGLDTFRPVTAGRSRRTSSTASGIASRRGLAADRGGRAGARRRDDDDPCPRDRRARRTARGRSDSFITPGFRFHRVDALLTNFHLPRTTPRARDGLRRRGAHAGALRPRDPRAVPALPFLGDAMLILRRRGELLHARGDRRRRPRRRHPDRARRDPTPAFMPVGTKGR